MTISPESTTGLSHRLQTARKLHEHLRSHDDLALRLLDGQRIDENQASDAIAHYHIPRGVIRINDGRKESAGCAFAGLDLFLVLHNGGVPRPAVEGRVSRMLGAVHAIQRAWAHELRDPQACHKNKLDFGYITNDGEPLAFNLSDLLLTSLGRWGKADNLEWFDAAGKFTLIEDLQFCSTGHLSHETRQLHDSTIVSLRLRVEDNDGVGESTLGRPLGGTRQAS